MDCDIDPMPVAFWRDPEPVDSERIARRWHSVRRKQRAVETRSAAESARKARMLRTARHPIQRDESA